MAEPDKTKFELYKMEYEQLNDNLMKIISIDITWYGLLATANIGAAAGFVKDLFGPYGSSRVVAEVICAILVICDVASAIACHNLKPFLKRTRERIDKINRDFGAGEILTSLLHHFDIHRALNLQICTLYAMVACGSALVIVSCAGVSMWTVYVAV